MQRAPVRIVPAQVRDLDAFCQLLVQYYGEDPTGELKEAALQTIRDARSSTYLAFLDEAPVGAMSIAKRISLEFRGLIWVIETLVVDKHYRRLGVGTALVQHSIEAAQRGRPKAILIAVPENLVGAAEFVQSVGFRETGTRSYAYLLEH